MKRFFLIIIILITGQIILRAQSTDSAKTESEYHNWFKKSPIDDQIFGAEVDKAYKFLLKDKQSTTVIVAVIDGGIDINHEDLKNHIWINQNEIPDNGIDDDQNGYIDDIHGWNFIGNEKGENISYENMEYTRVYKMYKDKFGRADPKKIADSDKDTYALFDKAREMYLDELNQATDSKDRIENFEKNYNEAYDDIKTFLNKEYINREDLDSIKTNDQTILDHVKYLKRLFENGFTNDGLDDWKEYNSEKIDYHLNLDFNPRDIIGDDINDINSPNGNNNVYGPEAFHGTFVAGIIAADRNNGIGIDGIVDNVKIMALKVVPNGDERDKDVAKAIRYAADNGARVINMSFGKDLSPQKQLVDDAIQYAEKKGVLLVHAAGNDGLNIDKVQQYPTKKINKKVQVNSWITVGASSIHNDLKFAANFTNYGKKSVDIFAPGVNIESLKPENKYEIASGTSFSSPVVTGVAALIISYYPQLTASEVKEIILNSALDYSKIKVYKPGEYSKKKKITSFKKLSSTGGIVSAYEALKLAEEMNK